MMSFLLVFWNDRMYCIMLKNINYINAYTWRSWHHQRLISFGAVHKVCHAFFDDFWPPLPLSQILDPLKVCHTSEQKVNKQISEKLRLPLKN